MPNSDGIKLEDIQVYDSSKGIWINYKGFVEFFLENLRIKPEFAHNMISKLYTKILCSEVREDLTFNDFLYGEQGYFALHPDIYSLVIVDGRFHSKYIKEDSKINLGAIGREVNSIPFLFRS